MKMEKVIVRPLKTKSAYHHIQMSDTLQAQLHIPLRSSIRIKCGKKTVHAMTSFVHDEKSAIYASHSIFETLHLPIVNIPLQLQYDEKAHILSLGPIIAIVTEDVTTSDRTFGNIHTFCEEFALFGEQSHAFVYVSSPTKFQQPDFGGYCFHEGKWEEYRSLPLPNVVYNRIHSRKFEQSEKYQFIIHQLHQYDIPFFNQRYLNKWEIHDILAEKSHLHPYVPKTALLDSKHALETYLHDFLHVFLKPIHGSQGRNIYQIQKENERFSVKESNTNPPSSKTFQQFGELYEFLYPQIKKEPYIVQEAIPLIRFKGRPVDFRILCHKKSSHKWVVTSAVARVSAENQFVSNIAKGGELHDLTFLLSTLFPATHHHIRKLLFEISVEAAKTISANMDGTFAEFGIDMALSEEGHPWLLEMNTKPSKNMTPNSSNSYRPSVKAIAHHCLYLAGYDG